MIVGCRVGGGGDSCLRAIVSVAPSWHRRAGVTLVADSSSVCAVAVQGSKPPNVAAASVAETSGNLPYDTGRQTKHSAAYFPPASSSAVTCTLFTRDCDLCVGLLLVCA